MADVVKAVTAEIKALPPVIRDSGLAASAIVLAERLSVAPPRDAASIGRELRESLAALQTLAKEMPKEADELDSLLARRPNLRIAGA